MSGSIDLRKKVSEPFVVRCVEHLRKIFFLKDCSESVLQMLASSLETRFQAPQDVLSREGEDCDHIILFGHGEATARVGGKEVKTVTDGAVLGPPLALLQKLPWEQTITTTAFSDIMVLSKTVFHQIVSVHNKDRAMIMRAAKDYDKRMRTKLATKALQQSKTKSLVDDGEDVDGDNAESPNSKGKAFAHRRNDAVRRLAETQMDGGIGEVVRPEDDNGVDLNLWVHAFLEEEGEALQRGMAAWLDQIEFFSQLDAFSLERLLKVLEKRSYKKGTHLLTEGEHADAMHVIYCGNVQILAGGKIVSKLGPKSILGERSVCVLGEQVIPCGATVTALSQVVVTLSMPRPQLLDLFIKDKHLYEHFRKMFDVERIKRGVASFRNIKLLEDADPNFTHLLESKVSQQLLQQGDILFTQGQPSSEAYLLCRGAVNIIKDGEITASLEVTDMKDAIIFGEFNVLGLWQAPKATVQAIMDCLFQVITPETLQEVFEEFPDESFVFRRLVEVRIEKENASYKVEEEKEGEAARKAADEEAKRIAEEEEERRLEEARKKAEEDANATKVLKKAVAFAVEEEDEKSSKDDESCEDESVSSSSGFQRGTSSESEASSTEPSAPRTEESVPVSEEASSQGSDEPEPDAPAGFLPIENQEADDDEAWAALEMPNSSMRQAINNDRIVLPRDLSEIQEFKDIDRSVLKQLQAYMKPRIYMPGQVLLRQGADMSHAFVLERGTCSVEVFGADLEPMEGPCVVGGMTSLFTKKVFTTVMADETCFVGAIPKHLFAAVLDSNPEARRQTLIGSDQNFKKLCDDFGETLLGVKGLIRQLALMPFLSGASEIFLAELAEVVEPRLLLPGQEVMQKDEKNEPQLIILFDGHFHFLQGGFVVGTMSPKMVAGVLEVFGLKTDKVDTQMKSDEICKVGTIRKKKLFEVLERFPEMRERFEALVHLELEEGINFTVLKQPMFEGMPSQFLKKVSMLLDRKLELPGATIVREGQPGDFMVIMNLGKAEIQMRGLSVGMLWPGKAFGGAQMTGSKKEYHASLVTKSTCHTLILSRRCLSLIIPRGPERPWLTALKSRSEISYMSEVKYFRKRHLQQRLLNKTGLANSGGLTAIHDAMFMHRLLSCWRDIVLNGGVSELDNLQEGENEADDSGSDEDDDDDDFDAAEDLPEGFLHERRNILQKKNIASEFKVEEQPPVRKRMTLKDTTRTAGSMTSNDSKSGGAPKTITSLVDADKAVKEQAPKAEAKTMREVAVASGRRLCFSRQLRRTMLTCGEEGQVYSARTHASGVVAPSTIAVPCRPRSAQTRPRPGGLQKAEVPVQKTVTQAAQSQTGVLIQLAQKVQETKTKHIYRKECREEAMQLERQLQEMQEQKAQKGKPHLRGLRFAEDDDKVEAPTLDQKAIPRPRQPGRLDGWQTIKPAPWLQVVREEIPRHVGSIKVAHHKFL